ncbi:MAG TPA: DMT family transporter [Planococcus sp. (in: firmicutes)]|nr:DMT family transporter [Planococcus sp. (in: firmicutes)]
MSKLKLYLILVLVMFVWGMNIPAVKYLTEQMGIVTMTSLRIFMAGIVVFILLFFMRLIRMPTATEWKYILGGTLLNVVIHHYFIAIGLNLTSGTNGGLIIGTGPIMTAIFGLLLIRLRPSRLQWLGFFLGFLGIAATILAGNSGATQVSVGDFYILLSILSQALSFLLISKAARTLDPRLLTAYMLLLGSFGLFIISLILEPGEWRMFGEMDSTFWLLIIGSGIMATAIGHMIYNYSVGRIGPSKAAIFMNLSTVFAILGSALFLGEIITINHLLGLVFVVCGVVLGSGAAEELWKSRQNSNNDVTKGGDSRGEKL